MLAIFVEIVIVGDINGAKALYLNQVYKENKMTKSNVQKKHSLVASHISAKTLEEHLDAKTLAKLNKLRDPVEIADEIVSRPLTLVFQFQARDLGVSKCGKYFQLPYSMKGDMIQGDVHTEAYFSKGRIIIPTRKGRKDHDKTSTKPARTIVDFADLA